MGLGWIAIVLDFVMGCVVPRSFAWWIGIWRLIEQLAFRYLSLC